MWRIITPIHFVITPISVGFHWDSLDERNSGGLAKSTLRLKYIIIQLQVEQNNNYSKPPGGNICRNLRGGGHDAGLNVCMSGVLLRAFV